MTADLALPTPRGLATSQATSIEQSRAVAEVQAAIFVAQQFPRDIQRAEAEMRDACGRTSLANRAFYRVTNRGNGPSVHLARELIRIWGNCDYGVRELHRDDDAGTSEILAYAWDQQTNTRSTRTFIVPHQRMVKDAQNRPVRKSLVDLQDVYLNNQNIGARAVRECIFTVLPDYYVEWAQDLARKTLEGGDGTPLPDRIAQMVATFADRFGVKVDRIERKLERRRGQWDAGDVATMQILYGSLVRGEVTVDEEFPPAPPTVASIVGASQTDAGATAPVEPGADPSPGAGAPGQGAPTPAPASPEQDWSRSLITAKQQSALHAALGELGITTRESVHAFCADKLGHPVSSTTNLTRDEAGAVIDAANAEIQRMPVEEPPEESP